MPYVKPALVKVKDRLRGRGRNSQAPPVAGASVYAPRHSNFSMRSVAQSVRGMMSHRNVDRAGLESRDSVLLRAGEQQHNGPFELADTSVGPRSLMTASDWEFGPQGQLQRQASSVSLLSDIEEHENETSQLEVTGHAGDTSLQPENAVPAENTVPSENAEQPENAGPTPMELARSELAFLQGNGLPFYDASDHLEVWGTRAGYERWFDAEGKPHLVFDPLRVHPLREPGEVNPPSEPDEGAAKKDDKPAEEPAEDKSTEDKSTEDKSTEDKSTEDKCAEDKSTEDRCAEDKCADDKSGEDKSSEDKSKKGKNPFSKLRKFWKHVSTKSGQQTAAIGSHPTVTTVAPDTRDLPPGLPVRSTLAPRYQHQLNPCGHFVQTRNPTVCGTNCRCFSAFIADKKLLEDSFTCDVCLEDQFKYRTTTRMDHVREQVKTFGLDSIPNLLAEIHRHQNQSHYEEPADILELRKENGGRFCLAAPAPLPVSHSLSTTTLKDNSARSFPTVGVPTIITTDPLGNDTVKLPRPSNRYYQEHPALEQYASDELTMQDFD